MDGPTAAAGAARAHRHLLAGLADRGFSDADARRPSLLPGWSVGHVLTHLARNADSHRRMAAAAQAGDAVDQYPGGPGQRTGEIDAGADRPAAALLEDLDASEAALVAALAGIDPATWATGRQRRNGRPWPLEDLPFLRWREVALHSTDLGLGFTPEATWAPAYVDHELRRQVAGLATRLPDVLVQVAPSDARWRTLVQGAGPGGPGPVATIVAPSVRILAWLVGRASGEPGWPPLSPWTGSP